VRSCSTRSSAVCIAGAFREDLYYRLADITIRLPPLRERLEDLPMLASYLIEQAARENGLEPRRLSPAALRRLGEYHWPGNVRELASVMKNALLFADGDEIGPDDLPEQLFARVGGASPEGRSSIAPAAPERSAEEVVYDRIRGSGISLFDMRRELEKACIARALDEAGGNISRAAALLGMKRPRLSQLVKEYGLAKVAGVGDNGD
jgi:sigma-54 specific flagellar transcriptional regulator A